MSQLIMKVKCFFLRQLLGIKTDDEMNEMEEMCGKENFRILKPEEIAERVYREIYAEFIHISGDWTTYKIKSNEAEISKDKFWSLINILKLDMLQYSFFAQDNLYNRNFLAILVVGVSIGISITLVVSSLIGRI